MNSISGFSGVDPQQMMQKMQDRIQQADTDQNGSLTKAEATAQMEESGNKGPNFEKRFDKADANGDGELSQEEQTQMFEKMQERMEQFESMGMSGGMGASGYGKGDTFQSLLDSLSSDDEDSESESDQRLKDALDQITSGHQHQSGTQPWQTLNELAPPVDTYA